MNKIYIFIFLLIPSLYCQSLQWSHTYHNNIDPGGWDIGYNAFEVDDGGFLIIGSTDWVDWTGPIWGHQFFIIRTDEFGDTIRTRMFCDSAGARDAIRLSNDTILVIGGRGIMLGVNQNGDSIFCNTIHGALEVGVNSTLTSDGYLFSTTCSISGDSALGYEPDSMVFLKHTIEGNVLWRRAYGVPLGPGKPVQTIDGGFICMASALHPPKNWVIRLDSEGDTLWTRYDSCGTLIVETDRNEFLRVGIFGPYIRICKMIDDGFIVWQRDFILDVAETLGVCPYCLIPTFDGNFVFCGATGGGIGHEGEFDGFLAKIDSLGNLIWHRRVDIAGRTDMFFSVIQTSDSGYVCTGYASVNSGLYENPETLEVCLVKFSKDGTIIWETGSRFPKEIALSVAPNPFNSSVRISVNIEQQGASAPCSQPGIEIFDISGHKVAKIIPPTPLIKGGGERSETGGSFLWQPDASLGSGVYLVRAHSGEKTTATRRVVYLK